MQKNSIEIIKAIHESGKRQHVEGVMVDSEDARRINMVFDSIDNNARKDIMQLPVVDVCDLAWEVAQSLDPTYAQEASQPRNVTTPFKDAGKAATVYANITGQSAPQRQYSNQFNQAPKRTLWQKVSSFIFVVTTIIAGVSLLRAAFLWTSSLTKPAENVAQSPAPESQQTPADAGISGGTPSAADEIPPANQPLAGVPTAVEAANTTAAATLPPIPSDTGSSDQSAQPSNASPRQNLSVDPAPEIGHKIDSLILAQSNANSSQVDLILSELVANSSATAQERNNEQATLLNKSGLNALKMKRYPEAADFFARALKADPDDPKLLSNLGFAQTFTGNLDSAKKNLYQSIQLAPKRSVAWGDLGLVLAKQQEQGKAVSCFLIGYKVSDGKTLGFLQSLDKDDDLAVRIAGALAVKKVSEMQAPVANY